MECFAKLRADLEYYGSGNDLPGIKQLTKEDQEKLKAALPKTARGKEEDNCVGTEIVEHIKHFLVQI